MPAASVWLVLATLALDALGVGIVVPIVPALIERLSGLPTADAAAWVGVSVATYAVAQFLAAPVLGALSDRFGRRVVILVSVFGIACNYVLLAFAPSLPWLFAGRLIAGATGASSSAATAYIADVTPPAQRARRFGLVGAVFGGAFVFGPAFGGLLGGIDLRLPFLVSAGLAATNFVFALFILPESLPPERRRAFAWRDANPVGSLGALTASRAGARFAFAWCCQWFAIGTLQTVFVLYASLRLGWGARASGFALGLYGLLQVSTQAFLVGRVTRALGERRAAVAGLCVAAVAYVLFAAAYAPWVLYLGMVAMAFGSVANPSIRAMLSASTPPDRQGQLAGGLASIEGFTSIVAPLVAASLFTVFAAADARPHLPGAPFLAAALLSAAAAAVVAGARVPVARGVPVSVGDQP